MTNEGQSEAAAASPEGASQEKPSGGGAPGSDAGRPSPEGAAAEATAQPSPETDAARDAAEVPPSPDAAEASPAQAPEPAPAEDTTVPADAAKDVARRLCRCGVMGILNFAPTTLQTPAACAVAPVDLAAYLEQLSFQLAGRPRGP